ncbi:MAG TPA: ABC transporter permease [Bryobacteraceae bacterium]|nr:ABC transporter permease [Bryobacteraceae bacterium]
MKWFERMLWKLRYGLGASPSRRDFEQEIEAHIDTLAQRFREDGMNQVEALQHARRQFGNLTTLKETRHEMQTSVWLETLGQDLRYGVRVLAKNRAFAVVAILTLALGIGANTAIFSIVNAAILRPLPYPSPERLTILWGNVKRVRVERRGASYPDYRDWREQSRSFEAIAAFDDGPFTLKMAGTPERIAGEYVAQPYFSLLGIHAALGRTFSSEEDRVPQRNAVAVLSDGLWQRRFGADPGIVGKQIQLNDRSYTVIGVAPPGFQGLSDIAEIWVPFVMMASAEDLNSRGARGFRVLARLRPGVRLEQGQAEMDAISNRLARTYPETNEARGVEISPLETELLGDIRKPLLVLLAAVGFVLLIACTNVANLLLARSETRRHEVALRVALGASRGRLVRQLLAESAVLTAFGCIAGILAAHYAIRALMIASPMRFPSFVQPGIDVSVALFAILICGGVALALSLAPATQIGSTGFEEALRQNGGRSTAGRQGSRLRDVLVVAEISISLLLLIGAGLAIRSLQHLAIVNTGYDPSHVLTFRVSLPQLQPTSAAAAGQSDAKVVVAANDILGRITGLAAIESAAVATDAPLSDFGGAVFYSAEGQPPMNAQNMPRAYFHRVSGGFFRTLHTRFIFGRAFTSEEIHNDADVAIVTEDMVKRFWPGQNPVGKRIKVGGLSSTRPWLTIVGVVEPLKYRGLPSNPTADPDLFQVFNERSPVFSVLARTSQTPSAMLSTIRTALIQAEPSILIYNGSTLEDLIDHETSRPRFLGWLMGIFAAMALVLAAIGIYGVISYGVSRRTREIGLRLALGSSRRDVLRAVLGRSIALLACGVLLGAAAGVALTRSITTLVYNVSATDPLTFTAAAALLVLVGIMACLVPAARASRIDPAVALREE